MNIIRKTFATVLASVAVLGASALLLAPAAHAENMNQVSAEWQTLTDDNQALIDAGDAADESAMYDACSTQQSDMGDFHAMTRPAVYPKVAWKHVQRFAALTIRADDACMSGDYVTSVALLKRATAELVAANEGFKNGSL